MNGYRNKQFLFSIRYRSLPGGDFTGIAKAAFGSSDKKRKNKRGHGRMTNSGLGKLAAVNAMPIVDAKSFLLKFYCLDGESSAIRKHECLKRLRDYVRSICLFRY